jgi:chemotaxis response regulator CheB
VRVLVADDSAVFRSGITRAINAHPALELVAQAEDGADALAAIREFGPDVVLLDINMPALDGIEVAEQSGRASRCVLISATLDELVVARAHAAGATECVDKALTRAEICAVLVRVGGEPGA